MRELRQESRNSMLEEHRYMDALATDFEVWAREFALQRQPHVAKDSIVLYLSSSTIHDPVS